MSTYRMDDGTILKTENAVQSWEEDTFFDGSNHISVPTGSQWNHQKLHRTRKGRYYVESWSQYQGSSASAAFVSREDAARWLLQNGHDLPEDLADLEAEISE